MTRLDHVRAPEDTRRRNRRPAWVRPFVRANRAISSSARLICSTLGQVSASERCVLRRPIRASRKLDEASARLVEVSRRLSHAARDLAKTNERIARDPQDAADVPEMLVDTTESWLAVSKWLGEVAGDLYAFQRNVLNGLETGILVAEPPAGRRVRIVLVPRPVPVRAFLLLRQPRATDRIASILRRRRPSPRPAASNVPRETDQGRAPPLS